jgi:DNA end-binding protein Ku
MATKTSITISLVTVPVTLSPAVEEEDAAFRTIHIGEHEPARVTVKAMCTHDGCDDQRPSVFAYPDRGREVDGKLVLVTKDEIAAATGEPIKAMVPAFHPREKVYAATVAGDSVQNVLPQKGYDKQYVALRNALMANPDVVACTVWAPRTKNALWVLEVVGDRIVASKRSWPEDVRAVPAAPTVDVSDAEQNMFNTLVADMVSDFDLTAYVNERKSGLDALVASRLGDAVALPAAGSAPAATGGGDLMAALQASVKAAEKKPATKKPAAKRTAKKTAAAKAA